MSDPATRYRIGIDLGGTKIEGILLGPDGSILERQRVATPHDGYHATLDAIARMIAAIDQNVPQDCPAATIGIGTPGAISPATGTIKNANSTCLNGHTLAEDLMLRLARPVRTANDANCFALSEAIDGAGKGAGVVFGVILGTGVGGAIVVDRKALTGPTRSPASGGTIPCPGPPTRSGRERSATAAARDASRRFYRGPGCDGTIGSTPESTSTAPRSSASPKQVTPTPRRPCNVTRNDWPVRWPR